MNHLVPGRTASTGSGCNDASPLASFSFVLYRMPAKSCLFCPTTDLTKEHLWPDWLVTEFKRLAPPKRGRYPGTHQSPSGRTIKFPAGTIEAKKRLVCRPGNNEWMNDIEGAAKDTLLPHIRNRRGVSTFDAE